MDDIELSLKNKLLPTGDQVVKTVICAAIAGIAGLFLAKMTDAGYDAIVSKIHSKSNDPQS